MRLVIGRADRPGRTLNAAATDAKERSSGAGSTWVVDVPEDAHVSFGPKALLVHFGLRLGGDGSFHFTLEGSGGLQSEE